MKALGISGWAGVGKTEAASYIERTYDFERRHIATPLRAMLRELLRANKLSDDVIHAYLEGPLKEQIIPELGVTSRQLQIKIGMWGRNEISPNLWSDTWMRGCQGKDRVMNDSVRFQNEERSIKVTGGFTVLITRPSTRPIAFKWKAIGPIIFDLFGKMWGVHDSERTDRLNPTYTIVNDGTIEDLHRKIDRVMALAGVQPSTKAASRETKIAILNHLYGLESEHLQAMKSETLDELSTNLLSMENRERVARIQFAA